MGCFTVAVVRGNKFSAVMKQMQMLHNSYSILKEIKPEMKPLCLSLQFVPILFVLSTSSMLILDQRTLQIKYRVPAAEIYRLSLSPYLDDVAVFHVRAVSSSTVSNCYSLFVVKEGKNFKMSAALIFSHWWHSSLDLQM